MPPLRKTKPFLLLAALNYFRSSGSEKGFLNSRKLALLLVTGLYFLSPIDLVPDMLPGIGQMDDGLLILFTLAALAMPRRSGAPPAA